MAPSIDILLATYNGARYLPEMLASLEAQQGADFRVLVRDDGSTDGTRTILADWAARRPGQVTLLPSDQPTGSAAGNFARLMAASSADYVLFADQDDLWRPAKVAATVAALRAGEAESGGTDRPVMAFCDLALVDGGGKPLYPSFRAFQGLDAVAGARFDRLLMNNVVTGCAMGVNRAALDICGTVPAEAEMHDWWLALICAGMGLVKVMPECLIDYRQHGGNVVGARHDTVLDALPGLRRLSTIMANIKAYRAWLDRLYVQAAAFETRHGAQLPADRRAVLSAFAGLRRQGPIGRRWTVIRHGFHLESRVQTLAFLLRM
ncbi:glycosyltransferase family 2 protein [Niveispirillum sp. KHB5.9]|uniref:glycosyltransferase family 2 protein n=1 Tax=Niveispirillum sp. KHB5.9 TaxID=3400269 RepID=UPI003A842677